MTRASKHTPGPWKAERARHVDSEPDDHAIMANDPEHGRVRIADVFSEADARLMESAPDLLAALETITDCAEAGADGCNMDLFIQQARAAIAAAKRGAA